MRTAVLAAVLALAVAAPATAQSVNNRIGRVSTLATTNRQIDLSNLSTPMPNTLQRASNTFSFSKLMRSLPSLSWPPRSGQSNLPAPSSFPSTGYPNSFVPQAPIVGQ